jgi:hypothetical protein
MRGCGAVSAPPHPGVRGVADAGVTTPAASRNIPAAQDHVPVHRLSQKQGVDPMRYTRAQARCYLRVVEG